MLDSGFHKQKIRAFRNPDSLTWGDFFKSSTDTDVIIVSSEDSAKTFVYVYFLFDSQECPSWLVFTRGSTIVFAPGIHANKW